MFEHFEENCLDCQAVCVGLHRANIYIEHIHLINLVLIKMLHLME